MSLHVSLWFWTTGHRDDLGALTVGADRACNVDRQWLFDCSTANRSSEIITKRDEVDLVERGRGEASSRSALGPTTRHEGMNFGSLRDVSSVEVEDGSVGRFAAAAFLFQPPLRGAACWLRSRVCVQKDVVVPAEREAAGTFD